MADFETRYCKSCNRTKRSQYFYKSNNREKYPEGYMDTCKDCVTMMVDNWNPDTYLWILQEADVPYIPHEWDKLMSTYARDAAKVTGATIVGRYIAKMQLKQYRDFRWKDSSFLQDLENKKMEEAMKRQGYEAQQIATAIDKANFAFPEQPLEIPEQIRVRSNANDNIYNEESQGINYFDQQNGFTEDSLEMNLTDEDKLMLRLKWGKYYKPEEWVRLEQLYNEFCQSYDIQSAGHIDTLKLICKTSLKANQLIDMGDIEGYQKMSKVYDQLMKSGKFTAAQNKAESGEFVDSISELVLVCEQEGFIPRYYTDEPGDKVDETLADMKKYTRSLVTEEMNLGNLIESAVREMAREEAKAEDEDTEDDLTFEEVDQLRQDEDYSELQDFIEDEEKADEELLQQLAEDPL